MKSIEVKVGNLTIGGGHPIVVQTMCNTHTSDIEASVAQCIRMYEAGAEMIRLTVPAMKDVEALAEIRKRLRDNGIDTPLVADVHFSSEIAIAAAEVVEKVRINPGNFHRDHEKACEQFAKLVSVCKSRGTAVRIGLNHGSLGERITTLYGNTPLGMKEAAMEWINLCLENDFRNVVVSLKASNTIVMVEAYRLLAAAMEEKGTVFPLHLGVTEAGEGEDGRIKSAVGIGALLADGIGDTIRVSLSEEPEAEIPVARHLVDYMTRRAGHMLIPGTQAPSFDWLHPERRATTAVGNVGGDRVPVVIVNGTGKETADSFGTDTTPDYIYCGAKLPAGASSYCDEGCRIKGEKMRRREALRRKREHSLPLNVIIRQLEEYNRINGTSYSYGQYVALVLAKNNRGGKR